MDVVVNGNGLGFTRRGTAVAVVCGIGVVALAVLGWIYVPAIYPLVPSADDAVAATREATRSQAIVTTRASALAALAGLGALVTIVINYRNSRTAAATLATTNRTFEITERGHLTDRYAKAIELLGNQDSIAIRLGGIYALQQFAEDTARPGDQSTVVEVLSSFVRVSIPRTADHTFVPRDEAQGDDELPFVVPPAKRGPTIEPAPDVLAAISVLAQLPVRIDRRADFGGVDFTGLSLRGARLVKAVLRSADLYGVDLRRAVMTNANFDNCYLGSVDLRGATLIGASLIGVILNYSDLAECRLSSANLYAARLDYSILIHAQLSSANLKDASLIGANLDGANLSRCDLRNVSAFGATFRRADLTGADLTGAMLENADLQGAKVDDGQLSDHQLATVLGLPKPGRSPHIK